MRVEEADEEADTLIVRTTGARYTFDLPGNSILAEQLIETEREAAEWTSSLSLAGLRILSRTDTECVLPNDNVTFGVQCDSLVMVVPHEELVLSCESRIGGRRNRLDAGHLLVADDWGGFAGNPDIPAGTGRLARVHLGADHWSGAQPGRVPPGGIDFAGISDNQTHLSAARPGWQLDYYLSPGDAAGRTLAGEHRGGRRPTRSAAGGPPGSRCWRGSGGGRHRPGHGAGASARRTRPRGSAGGPLHLTPEGAVGATSTDQTLPSPGCSTEVTTS